MVHSLEISCLSHSFSKTSSTNTRWILWNQRRFVFLRGWSTKTYLTFYTGITKCEISSCLHRLFLELCKVLFLTSFCREYCEQMEPNFWNLIEVYLPTILIYNNIFHFLHIDLWLRDKELSMDPNFVELLGQNAQRKDAVSDLDASSSIKSCYQIRISLIFYHNKYIYIVPNIFISLSVLYLSSINVK